MDIYIYIYGYMDIYIYISTNYTKSICGYPTPTIISTPVSPGTATAAIDTKDAEIDVSYHLSA